MLNELSVNAHKENKKFKSFMVCEWSSDIETIKSNLVTSTIFVEKLLNNKENADVLPSPLNSFIKHCSLLYAQKTAMLAGS